MIPFQNRKKKIKMLIACVISYEKHMNLTPKNLQTRQNMKTFQPQHEIKFI